jgi:CRP-like cAMP-binding protein
LKIAESLGRMPLLAHVPPEQLQLLATCVSRNRFPPGATILRQGDPTLDAYFVESGEVRILRQTPYGLFTLALLGKGDLFGEASFIDASVRSGEAVAESDALLLALHAVAVEAAVARDPRLGMALYWVIWKSLSAKLRATNEKLTQFFAHGGAAAVHRPSPRRSTTGEFRVDLHTKRDLFAEQRLSSLEINFLTSLSRERKLKPDEVLFREGEAGDAMYVVLEGRIRISKYIPGAGEEALAFVERGDYFGEMALIDNQPRSAEARAHDDGAVVLAIPKNVVEGLLDMRKVASLRLLRILCSLVAKRLREIDDKLVGWFILAGGAPT